MRASPLEQRVTDTIQASLEGLGYALVQVRFNESAKRPILAVMVERKDGKGMTLDDCTLISGQASALLDVEDPIKGAYQLEVSSPGIDRPLVRREDFARFAGYEAKVESEFPVEGRKRFRGHLIGVQGDDVAIEVDKAEYRIALANIRTAKLVLNEQLIKEAMKKTMKKT